VSFTRNSSSDDWVVLLHICVRVCVCGVGGVVRRMRFKEVNKT